MVKIRNLCTMLIVSFVLLSLSSCGFSYVDVDKKYDGLSIGFNYEDDLKMTYLDCAVRSEYTEFNINNVTIECYYGWYVNPPSHYYPNGFYDPICVGLYFLDGLWKTEFEDYKNIEDMDRLL